MRSAPSPAHELVRTLWQALRSLGAEPTPLQIETWGLAVHSALASKSRQFHSHEHVMELCEGASPLEVVAAIYHDLVYVQVDGELPAAVRALLEPLLERTEGASFRVLPRAADNPLTAQVLAIFGRNVGDVMGPFCGLNELASAWVLVMHLGETLPTDQLVELAACIEATIPFRLDPGASLATRLADLGWSQLDTKRAVEQAVRFANRDVDNFSDPDAARFLANTWKLLPETNPSLHVPSRYTVGDYRVALLKMETFLEKLDPARVFHAWGDEPSPEEHARLIAAAGENIRIAVRYLRVKLYAIALIEAICLASGGDLPLQYVMGAIASRGEKSRLESFLPIALRSPRVEEGDALPRLLAGGRAGSSSFDIAPSPLASYLLTALGEPAICEAVAAARSFWAGEKTPLEFLRAQEGSIVSALASAAAELAETRRESLANVLAELSLSFGQAVDLADDGAPASGVASQWPAAPRQTQKFRRLDWSNDALAMYNVPEPDVRDITNKLSAG